MKRILTLLVFATACSAGPKVPKELLQPEKMQAIMLDLVNVDGRIANTPPADSLLRRPENRYRMYQQVFALHGTNKKQFTQSLKYYEQHPPLLKGVIEGMEKDITTRLSDTTNKEPERRPLPL